MRRAILAFELDDHGHWVAQLACGHGVHMRHDPPWQVREWVMTSAGRSERIGTLVECKRCEVGRIGSSAG